MKLADREFIIDESRCFGCAACITLCPTHALTLDNLLVFVNQDKCTFCNLCIPACPVFALSIDNTVIQS